MLSMLVCQYFPPRRTVGENLVLEVRGQEEVFPKRQQTCFRSGVRKSDFRAYGTHAIIVLCIVHKMPIPSLRPAVRRPATTFALPNLSRVSVRNVGRKTPGVDPQVTAMRRALYPSNIRHKETPTGTWRPDVAQALRRSIPSAEVHDTIERAWLLRERHLRWRRNSESTRKFECMRKAMVELEKLDPMLFREANRVEDPRELSDAKDEPTKKQKGGRRGRLSGLFPMEMRLPTDTPSRTGWNYDWTIRI